MSLNTDSPDAKKPCKGILKSSSSFDKHTTSAAASMSHRKSAKFDELNVLQTYHPADKDYGHMKVDEPKTPYNYVEEGDVDQLDAELLAEKLRVAASARSDSVSEEEESSEEEEEDLTEDQKKRKHEFQKRRKAHYNEFEAVKLARKLIEEEGEDEDEEDVEGASHSQGPKSSKSDEQQKMEVEDQDEVDRKNGEKTSSKLTAVTLVMPEEQTAGPDCESGPVETEGSPVRATRKWVISLIGTVSVVLIVLSMICVVFFFHLY